MDFFDQYKLFSRKYLFSVLLILAGIICIIIGISTNANADLSQSSYFIFGAIGLFLLGFMSLFFIIKQKITRTITVILSLVFIGASSLYLYLNVKTVQEEIVYQKEVEESENLAKQGLKDIQKLQDAFEKKYRKYAISFDELSNFAEKDSIRVLVKAVGDLPDEKMTVPEARQLGYQYPKDVWTESDALKLGKIVREYAKIPVADDLFNAEEQKKQNRVYAFNVDKIQIQRTIENDTVFKEFKFQNIYNPKDSTTFVMVSSIAPYGPQKGYDIKEVFQVGSQSEKNMKTNWK